MDCSASDDRRLAEVDMVRKSASRSREGRQVFVTKIPILEDYDFPAPSVHIRIHWRGRPSSLPRNVSKPNTLESSSPILKEHELETP